MGTRVQVILDETERLQFAAQARVERLSLSAWMRRAGQERLAAEQTRPGRSVEDLRVLFQACEVRETAAEPDWDQHLRVMDEARRRGRSST